MSKEMMKWTTTKELTTLGLKSLVVLKFKPTPENRKEFDKRNQNELNRERQRKKDLTRKSRRLNLKTKKLKKHSNLI